MSVHYTEGSGKDFPYAEYNPHNSCSIKGPQDHRWFFSLSPTCANTTYVDGFRRRHLFYFSQGTNMTIRRITLQHINSLNQEEFVHVLSSLFEGPPWIVTDAWHARPFHSRTELYNQLCEIIYHATSEQQIALLHSHPDLVGRAALAGTLSPASTNEQASAGLDSLTLEEIATFTQLNATYKNRFGFPFVICARANKKESILAGFAARMENSRRQEIATALGEVAKICAFRLHDLVSENGDE